MINNYSNRFSEEMCSVDSSKKYFDGLREQFECVNIPTSIYLILMTTPLKGSEMKVLLWILHKTIGNNRRAVDFDINEWGFILDLHFTTVGRCLTKLESLRIIERAKGEDYLIYKGKLYLTEYKRWNDGHSKDLIERYEEKITYRRTRNG